MKSKSSGVWAVHTDEIIITKDMANSLYLLDPSSMPLATLLRHIQQPGTEAIKELLAEAEDG